MTIEYLQDSGLTPHELSGHITEVETGGSPPLRDIRQNAYVSLQQTHILKLAELDIVSHDEEPKVVLLAGAGDVTVYTEVVSKGELSWSEYYAALAAPGIVLMITVAVGIPVVSAIGAPDFGSLVFVIPGGSTVY